MVQESGKEQDAEKVATDMSLDNKDAPVTPSDYQEGENATKVKSNKGK